MERSVMFRLDVTVGRYKVSWRKSEWHCIC